MEDVKANLQAALKEAMLNKDNARRDVLRLAMSAIKQVEVDERKTLSPEETVAVLQRELKQRRESLDEARNNGRDQAVAEHAGVIAILESFLPQQMTRDEVAALVRQAIAQTGASSAKEMGKVMGVLMPQVRGRADGKMVNDVVRELLS